MVTETKTKKTSKSSNKRYIGTVGRRKTAIARVRITESSTQSYVINDKELKKYFPIKEHQLIVESAFKKAGITQKFFVSVVVRGGGTTSQAEAIRLGVSRALILFDGELRKALKSEGYLKRDPRVKERKKFGLKKARKAPQWSKR